MRKTPDSTNRRVNIHKIIRNTQLSKETREANKEEAERVKRLDKKQKVRELKLFVVNWFEGFSEQFCNLGNRQRPKSSEV